MGRPRRPNLFIVGVAKAGTTSLHSMLATHPQVFMSTPKEPHYLAAPEAIPAAAYALNAIRDEVAYLQLFAEATEPVLGESSTTNWWHPETAARIDSFSPGSHAIVILRDPVERAFSHYLNEFRNGREGRPFAATLTDNRPGPAALRWGDPLIRLELGFYAERLRAYREVFGERLLVLFSKDLSAEPAAQLSAVFDLLELKPPESLATDGDRANVHRMPRNRLAGRLVQSPGLRRVGRKVLPRRLRHRGYESLMRSAAKPEIDAASAERLRALYAADRDELAAELGRPLPW